MTDSERTSSDSKVSRDATPVSSLLETALRHYRAGHYSIALTALEQAAKEHPENETIELAMVYLRTNMVALKARDAGMPVKTPEPPPFFLSDEPSDARTDEERVGRGLPTSFTMELDAELPQPEEAKGPPNAADHHPTPGPISSVELEAMLPDNSETSDEALPGFGEETDSSNDSRRGSPLELDALPPEDSEEISLESFGDINESVSAESISAESSPSGETSPPIDDVAATDEDEPDDLFSQDDLDLLASDDEAVEALSTQGEADRLEADQRETVRIKPAPMKPAGDVFSEDEPTIARTSQQTSVPSAFASAVAQAQQKQSPARAVSQDPQINVVFDAAPSKAPVEPSSMTITGMPLPDFLREESTEGIDRGVLQHDSSHHDFLEEEAKTTTRNHAPADADSFDEAPTIAKDYTGRHARADEVPTTVRQSSPDSANAFDEAPTISRESAQPESDAFDDAPTIARQELSHQDSEFPEQAPTRMRHPDHSTITGDGDWTAAPAVQPELTDSIPSAAPNDQIPQSGEQSPLLPTNQDSLSLAPSDVPDGMLSESETIERDTWRRRKDQGRPRPQDLLEEAKHLFDNGEHTKSLELCMRVAPVLEESADLDRLIRENEEILTSRYVVQLGGLEAVPLVTFEGQDLQALGMDHKKAFLLTRIDGILTIDEILMISGMSRLETARSLMELKLAGLLSIDDGNEEA